MCLDNFGGTATTGDLEKMGELPYSIKGDFIAGGMEMWHWHSVKRKITVEVNGGFHKWGFSINGGTQNG